MKDKETVRAKARHLKEATAKMATNKQPKKMNEGLAFLIEDALQRSEVVIAAEAISTKLQGMAEDLSTIEAKDIMPLNDALTNAFGPQVAQKFNAVATEQIRQLVTAVQTAKSGLDGEILRLKQGVEGGDVTDMGMDAGMASPAGAAPPGLTDEPPGPDVGPGAMPEGPPEAMPPGPPGDEDVGIPAAAGPAVGRARKESAQPKGKRVTEFAEPRSHESLNFSTNIDNIGLFHGGAGRAAQNIANLIRTEKLSETQRKGLANVLSHISAYAADPSHWSGMDADHKLEGLLRTENIWETDKDPAIIKIVSEMKELAHLVTAKHKGMLESNIRLLRKAVDPDALILKTFRTSLAENRDGQMAAIRTARTFAIDIEDVVAVVREAVAHRPKTRVREAGEFTGSVGAEATTTPAAPQAQAQQQQPGQPVGMANQMGQEIPIFPVEQNQPASLGATPSEPTGNAVQPNPMQPANQSASTIKPQSPADMRVRQAQQKMAAVPPQPNQPAQPQQAPRMAAQQPQRPQQPQQSRQTPSLNLPGQTMAKSNPAQRRFATR